MIISELLAETKKTRLLDGRHLSIKNTHLTEAIVFLSSWVSCVGEKRFSYQRKIKLRTIAEEGEPILQKRKNIF